MLTTAFHWILFWGRRIQSTPTHPFLWVGGEFISSSDTVPCLPSGLST